MVGLLHVPRDLWRVGDREAPGVNLKLAGFQGQGLGNSSPAKVNQPMAHAESPDVNSFFPLWSCLWMCGLDGKCMAAPEGGFWQSCWSRFSDFVIEDLPQVTLRWTLPSK